MIWNMKILRFHLKESIRHATNTKKYGHCDYTYNRDMDEWMGLWGAHLFDWLISSLSSVFTEIYSFCTWNVLVCAKLSSFWCTCFQVKCNTRAFTPFAFIWCLIFSSGSRQRQQTTLTSVLNPRGVRRLLFSVHLIELFVCAQQ